MMPGEATALYWVITKDHDEDWFILSSSISKAQEWFENSEGYDPGDAKASFLERLPKGEWHEEGYATYKLVKRLGYNKITRNGLHVFSKHGKTLTRGSVTYRLFLRQAHKLAGVYIIHALDSRLFKIGHTTDLKRRLHALQTGSPVRLQARIYIITPEPQRLERILHKSVFRKPLWG